MVRQNNHSSIASSRNQLCQLRQKSWQPPSIYKYHRHSILPSFCLHQQQQFTPRTNISISTHPWWQRPPPISFRPSRSKTFLPHFPRPTWTELILTWDLLKGESVQDGKTSSRQDVEWTCHRQGCRDWSRGQLLGRALRKSFVQSPNTPAPEQQIPIRIYWK